MDAKCREIYGGQGDVKMFMTPITLTCSEKHCCDIFDMVNKLNSTGAQRK